MIDPPHRATELAPWEQVLSVSGRHRCRPGSSGRCPCGLHRAAERAVHFAPLATADERLALEL